MCVHVYLTLQIHTVAVVCYKHAVVCEKMNMERDELRKNGEDNEGG